VTVVIDASVALKWVIDEGGSEAAREVLLEESLGHLT
jgi:predicted nucleic acid-binding protein